MEITLNVKSDQVSDSLSEIMTHLTTEQKENLAKQMLNKWLEEPCVVNQVTRDTEVIREMRASSSREVYAGGKYVRASEATDEQIKMSSEFRERVNKYQTPKEKMMSEIMASVIAHHQKEVSKAIELDPRMNEVKDATIGYLRQNYGSLVQNAIMYWLAEHMGDIASNLQNTLCRVPSLEQEVQAINQRLLQQ
jgi:uncharacterized protein YgbK (DUF1537 family)